MGGGKIQKINKQRTNSKSKSSTSSLFDWSSPPLSVNRTLTNASDVVYQPPSGNRRKQQPKAPEVAVDSDGQEEEEGEEDDDDEEEPTAEPVDIEVTIYDNRKVK